MFKALNEKYQQSIADAEDERIIMEAITGSDMDTPEFDAVEQAADSEVDIYSVPRQDLDKLDKYAEKLVSASTYDDDDIDDLLDDGYENEIIVSEATVTTPSGDEPGDYNSGIKSGEVNYKMTDCEDRGGVGVNSVIVRNDQLSENAMEYALAAMNESANVLLEAAEETAEPKAKNGMLAKAAGVAKTVFGTIGGLFRRFGKWFAGVVSGAWKKLSTAFKKLRKNKGGKDEPADTLTDTDSYRALPAKGTLTDTDSYRALPAKGTLTDDDIARAEIVAKREAGLAAGKAKYDTVKGFVRGVYEAGTIKKYQMMAKYIAKYMDELKAGLAKDNVGFGGVDVERFKKFFENNLDIDFSKEDISFDEAEKFANSSMASNAAKAFADVSAEMSKLCATGEKLASDIMAKAEQHSAEANRLQNLKGAAWNSAASRRNVEFSQSASFGKCAKGVSAILPYIRKIANSLKKVSYLHASNIAAFQAMLKLRTEGDPKGYAAYKDLLATPVAIPESADYIAAYQMARHGDFSTYISESTGVVFFGVELEAAMANSDTYEEFKEHLKSDGTLNVEAIDFGSGPKDDLSRNDVENPLLAKAAKLADDTLCQAYTAEQLEMIPAGKIRAIAKKIDEAIEMYNEQFDAAKDLDECAEISDKLYNLQSNAALIESIICEASDKDDDDEVDLDDLDAEDNDDKDDKKKSKKSKKSDECDDDECDDEDEDEKKSKKKSKKDDDDEEDEDLDESASLLSALTSLMDALV